LVFDLADNFYVVINLQNALPKMTSDIKYIRNFYRFKIDPRLLKRALTGPHLANWNNIEIGAHLGFSRNPDVFKPGVHTLINAMHV
jgi:UDP-MurNAc hydroxylase